MDPEWDPDDPSKNGAGWQAAIMYAGEVFRDFIVGVQTEFPEEEGVDILGMLGLTRQERDNRSVTQKQLDMAEKTKTNPKYNQMLRQNPEVAGLIDRYLRHFHQLAWLRENHPDKEDSIRNIEEKLDLCELELDVWTSVNRIGPPGLGSFWIPGL